MAQIFALSYMDTLEKVLTIVKRDAEHVKADESGFGMKVQIDSLLEAYSEVDPDLAFQKINNLEKNKLVLSEEISFMLKMLAVNERNFNHHPNRHFNIGDGIRFTHLMSKYELKCVMGNNKTGWNMTPIQLAFPDEEYTLKKENPSLYCALPDGMKKYKNFKKEYNVYGIMAMLPSSKKYGGFVKALLNVQLILVFEEHPELMICGEHVFHSLLAKLRKSYNCSIFSEEKRLEWFEKLAVKEDDCALWSRLFDHQYPGYKEVHKFFNQVA